MASVIPDEIHALVPDELKSDYGIYWQEKTQRYYVYRDLGHIYDPKKGRSHPKRIPLGSIKDGTFSLSPSYKKNQEIAALKRQVSTLSGEESVDTVEETITKSGTKGLVKQIRKAVKEVGECRQEGKIEYPLETVLFVALLAACGGYTSAVSIAIYWRQNRAELTELLGDFPESDISHDTVNCILRLISPEHFQELLRRVTVPLVKTSCGRLLHIDGQAVEATKTVDSLAGRYVFNAYDSTNGLALASKLIGEKKNEISEAQNLLNMLDLQPGDIVTADAMNTQKSLAKYLHERGAHYCFAVKDNHPTLTSEIRALFSHTNPDQIESCEDVDAGHDRVETRRIRVICGRLLSKIFKTEWTGLGNGSIVLATTQTEKKSRTSIGTDRGEMQRYFITTLEATKENAAEMMRIVRRHWSIENDLHWVLDTAFDQGRIQCKNENYLQNRLTLNKMGLNILRAAQTAEQARGAKKISVKSYMQLCNTAGGALDVISLIPDVDSAMSEDVKG